MGSSLFNFIRGITVTGFGMASVSPLPRILSGKTWDGLVGRLVERGLASSLGYDIRGYISRKGAVSHLVRNLDNLLPAG